jgi:hypothetical protein
LRDDQVRPSSRAQTNDLGTDESCVRMSTFDWKAQQKQPAACSIVRRRAPQAVIIFDGPNRRA